VLLKEEVKALLSLSEELVAMYGLTLSIGCWLLLAECGFSRKIADVTCCGERGALLARGCRTVARSPMEI
jgi:hypothetical protein